ncbi:hypothetical protein HPB50_001035 [Hyalomma asiaticum]|uniref:Uncharacterized protein n=1 Tax=Hyalomma asiaticum TaxID=266040 RepID=A0ACB7RNK9_HYAAI|nr:hypothetical protein HPB50_001035 [Hyalomma asiaticum]
MSHQDLNSLCYYLNLLHPVYLHRIDDFRFSSWPRLSGSTRERAVRDIRSFLESVQPVSLRVGYVAWFYCWLMSHHVLGPWLAYRINVSPAPSYDNLYYIPERLADAMGFPSCGATLATSLNRFGRFACIVVRDTVSGTLQQVVCIRTFDECPYLVVCPLASTHVRRLRSVLSTVLRGDPGELLVACGSSLNAATLEVATDYANLR